MSIKTNINPDEAKNNWLLNRVGEMCSQIALIAKIDYTPNNRQIVVDGEKLDSWAIWANDKKGFSLNIAGDGKLYLVEKDGTVFENYLVPFSKTTFSVVEKKDNRKIKHSSR